MLTQKQKDVLKRLAVGEPVLLTGIECISARRLRVRGLAIYEGTNHYAITDAGRAALQKEEGE